MWWRPSRSCCSATACSASATRRPASAAGSPRWRTSASPSPGAAGLGDRLNPGIGNGGYDARHYEIDLDKPYGKLTAKQQKVILHGVDGNLKVKYKNRYGRTREYNTAYEGIIPWLNRRREGAESDWAREQYEGYMREVPCTVCSGARLKPETLAVTINERNIAEVVGVGSVQYATFRKTAPASNCSPGTR